MTFGEDPSRIRKDHADTNFSLLRRQALSPLQNEPTSKVGIKNKRLTAALNEDCLLKVLCTVCSMTQRVIALDVPHD